MARTITKIDLPPGVELLGMKSVPTASGKPLSRIVCLLRCSCGRKFAAWKSHLKQGNTASCGCKKSTRLGLPTQRFGEPYSQPQHPLHFMYARWTAMWARCMSPGTTGYKNYGGRGITVCERWMSFENFLNDMGVPIDRTLSLDRIDNDGNYEPGNCRWATKSEQSSNQRPRKKVK